MKKILAPLLLAATACQPAAERPPAAAPAAVAGRAQPSQAVVGFLNWYKQHLLTAGSINFIDNAQDTSKAYAVNLAKAEAYLAGLKKSSYLSDAYLDGQRRYFRRMGDSLRVHPQKDGPPAGFDFDLVTQSQEPGIYLEGADRARLATAYPSPTQAVVTADFMPAPGETDRRVFYLRRGPAGWLIDSLATQ
jgi:hypothetical protein